MVRCRESIIYVTQVRGLTTNWQCYLGAILDVICLAPVDRTLRYCEFDDDGDGREKICSLPVQSALKEALDKH